MALTSQAQTEITGWVEGHRGSELAGANVYLYGTFDGAFSDSTGYFHFSSTQKDCGLLIVSYLGYETQEEKLLFDGEKVTVKIRLKEEAADLDEVVITAGAFEASDEKKGMVLKSLDIVTTAGATADISAALNTLPGTQTVGEEGQLFVRGGAASETRTFIDGLQVPLPYSSTVPDVPARGRFSPFLFKGTLFSTGGYSAEYGQALSSALILQTQDMPDKTLTSISLMSVGGSLGHTQKWEKSSLAFEGGYTNLSPYMKLIPQNLNWEKAPQGPGGAISYRYQPSQTGLFKVFASFNNNSMRMTFPSLNDATQLEHFANQNTNLYTNANYKEIVGKEWLLKAGLSATRDQNEISFATGDVSTRLRAIQAKAVMSRSIKKGLKFKGGATSWVNQFDEKYTPAGTDSAFQTLLNERLSGVFSEVDFMLKSKIAVRAGVRGEYSGLLQRVNVAPRISAAYLLSKHSQLSLAAGRFYQTPDNDLMRATQDLNFEQADHLILNFQYHNDKRTLRIEGYQKWYDQLVKFDAARSFDPAAYSNTGNGYARGLDIFWRDKKTFKRTDYWVSYSFLDTERDYRNYPSAARPYFASKHNLSIVAKHFILPLHTQIGFTYNYASSRPYHDPNTNDFMSGKTPAYHNLSFNASYLTDIAGHFTILYVSATNLLGTEQIFGYRYASLPDIEGVYASRAVTPPAKRFLFVGLFISIEH